MSPSDLVPRPLTVEEIRTYAQWYVDAAEKAVNGAGFDGVELHYANGYLPDQFLQDISNNRTDEYGGPVENRARFPLEIIEAVANAVGEDRIGIRISPWNTWQGMKMEDPKPTFSYFVSQVKERFPNTAYIHAIEPRVAGIEDRQGNGPTESNQFLRDIWGDKPFISAGGHTPQTATETANTLGGLVAFGRHYIANVSFFLLSIYNGPSSDFPWIPARPAIAHQARCSVDQIPTFDLLQSRGPTRLHRLPSRYPLPTHWSNSCRRPEGRRHG